MNHTAKNDVSTSLFFLLFRVLFLFRWAFSGLLKDGAGGQKDPLPKICHIYPVMMKLDIVIPYPKKIQKTYKSSDMLLSSAGISVFQLFLYQEILYGDNNKSLIKFFKVLFPSVLVVFV